MPVADGSSKLPWLLTTDPFVLEPVEFALLTEGVCGATAVLTAVLGEGDGADEAAACRSGRRS